MSYVVCFLTLSVFFSSDLQPTEITAGMRKFYRGLMLKAEFDGTLGDPWITCTTMDRERACTTIPGDIKSPQDLRVAYTNWQKAEAVVCDEIYTIPRLDDEFGSEPLQSLEALKKQYDQCGLGIPEDFYTVQDRMRAASE